MSDITVTEESSLPLALRDDTILTALIKAEARVDAFVKIKIYALKATTNNDWVALGNRPYLQDTGTEKIAALFSPVVSMPDITKESFPDGHYTYFCDGMASWGGKEIPVMGSRSSKDKFFVQYDYVDDGNKKKRVELSTDELLGRIDSGDVRKSALTNYRNNAIKDVLGLEGVTWEDLEAAGIKKQDVVGVEYGGDEQSPEAKDNKSKIATLMTEMYGPNYSARLKELTAWETKDGQKRAGKTSLNGVSDKQMYVIYGKVKTAYEAWQKQPKPELLGVGSKRFGDAVKAVERGKTEKEVNDLITMGIGIFTPDAIDELKNAGEAAKANLNDPQF